MIKNLVHAHAQIQKGRQQHISSSSVDFNNAKHNSYKVITSPKVSRENLK